LDQIAGDTGHQIALTKEGARIGLVQRGPDRTISSVDGPFRVVAKEVVARRNLETGRSWVQVGLELHWEPRFPVFRVETQPRITLAKDDLGNALTAPLVQTRSAVTGYTHPAAAVLENVPRKATRIATLAGSFTATAADQMLAVTFPDLNAKLPATQTVRDVRVTLTKFAKEDGIWEAELELRYPQPQPVFESFESWWGLNKAVLVGPGGKAFPTGDYEVIPRSNGATARYRFAEDRAKGPALGDRRGWSLVCETPSPLKEVVVKFELKDVPLP
jgi:hypothetical protein